MAKTKNTERKTGLAPNPFRWVNADAHSIELLDMNKVKQLCTAKGKNVWIRIRMHIFLMKFLFHIQTHNCTPNLDSILCVVDQENQALKESKDVDEQASLSLLSEFTNTPAYSPFSQPEMERDADLFYVDVDCEVHTVGEGPTRNRCTNLELMGLLILVGNLVWHIPSKQQRKQE